MSITIVDSIMGSGKSTWARRFINEHPDYKWWFVTPYLKEIEETIESCKDSVICQPTLNALNSSSSKMDHLLKLINEGRNIALTHKLFLSIKQTPELLETIRSFGYHLIIDEAMDVVEPIPITKDDITEKVIAGTIHINPHDLEVTWENKDYEGVYRNCLEKTEIGRLYLPNDNSNAMIWMYHHEIFSAFSTVHILTYLFPGSRMYHYFQIYGLSFDIKRIEGGDLVEWNKGADKAQKREKKRQIHIYQGHLNDIDKGKRSQSFFSHNWYTAGPRYDKQMMQLFNNTYNYLHSIRKAKSGNSLYTTYKEIAKNNPLRSYKKAFLPCNQRASNEFEDCFNLAYLVNIYENPAIIDFFQSEESRIIQTTTH